MHNLFFYSSFAITFAPVLVGLSVRFQNEIVNLVAKNNYGYTDKETELYTRNIGSKK